MAESVANDGSFIKDSINSLTKIKHGGFSGTPGKFIFPGDLKDGQEAIRFEIFAEYQFDRKENKRETGSLSQIYLPIPQNLQAAYGVEYQQSEIGFLGREGARLASGRGIDNSAENLTGGTLNLLAQAIDSGAAGAAAAGGAAKAGSSLSGAAKAGSFKSKILGQLGGTVGAIGGGVVAGGLKGAQFGLGTARNPHMAQVFKNVNFRTHQLSFKLAPKSIDEQNILKSIIKSFKMAMHPKYKLAQHFFDYPAQFDIDLITGKSDEYFFNIGPSVLTSMSVDYLPNGPHMHDVNGTKAPLAVALNLQFTETKIVTQDEIQEFNF